MERKGNYGVMERKGNYGLMKECWCDGKGRGLRCDSNQRGQINLRSRTMAMMMAHEGMREREKDQEGDLRKQCFI